MKSPSSVDMLVGDRLRSKRIALGISLEKLADEVGSTIEQVQQWEAGADRVGAIYLRKLSAILAVDPDYFFPDEPRHRLNGYVGVKEAVRPKSVLGLAASVEDLRLIHAFSNIKNVAFREIVVKLAEAMAESECEANRGLDA
jgi:transcriptional regulator with XRE-family HTH domain